jgi:molecular chaperone DnaJ
LAPQQEWFEVDYYKVLGVADDAPEKEVTHAYRQLAKQYHPDANPGSEDRFKEISAAYDVLGDPEKRKEYDEVRRLAPIGGAYGAGNGGFQFRVGDFADMFGSVFRQQGGGGMRRTNRAGMQPRRGADVEAFLHLDFNDAISGVVTSVNVTTGAVCLTCAGTGAAPGSRPVTCERCNGLGVLNDNQGLFSLSSPCPDCRGRGTKILNPCTACHGTGVEQKGRQVKVRIPAGVDDGQKIRIKGRGNQGRNGGPPGDLYITVNVAPHPVFGRRGRDLLLTVPISFAEATLGGTLRVPSLNGKVGIRMPAGTRSGKTFRVRGKGITTPAGTGDLLVTVEIAIPTELTDEQRAAIEALGEVLPSPRDQRDQVAT